MFDIVIRPITNEDLPRIVALLADDALGAKRELPSEPLHVDYQRAYESILADDNQNVYACIQDGRIVGCMQLSFIPGLSHVGSWRAQVESIRVASAARGQRVGERMIAFAIERAKAKGCRFLQLTTDKTRLDARRFYERLGFKATHEGMKLALDAAPE